MESYFLNFGDWLLKISSLPPVQRNVIKAKKVPRYAFKIKVQLLILCGIYIKKSIQNVFFIIKISKSPLKNFPGLLLEIIVSLLKCML